MAFLYAISVSVALQKVSGICKIFDKFYGLQTYIPNSAQSIGCLGAKSLSSLEISLLISQRILVFSQNLTLTGAQSAPVLIIPLVVILYRLMDLFR